MLQTAELDYELPPDRIAVKPAEPRDSARLLVVSRSDESVIEHAIVRDLPRLLRRGDVLVVNTTDVLPAWLEGSRVGTGGRVEGLFLHAAGVPGDKTPPQSETGNRGGPRPRWIVLLRGRHLREGVRVEFRGPRVGGGEAAVATLVRRFESEPGAWEIELEGAPTGLREALERFGATPIPPYIRKARRASELAVSDDDDRSAYQTVYADPASARPEGASVAAPTAGLHFTTPLLERLSAQGVERMNTVLHVGPGTFRPVETGTVEEHPMHAEWCSMPGPTIATIRAARREGRRVICVGTTSARSVETYAQLAGHDGLAPVPEWYESRLLITPGFEWRLTDGLMTNFHLPRSTLMAMVGALFPRGVARLREIYAIAIREQYRFYSYGDAMLVLP